jgi:gamma-glutamylcyclotransferase (GGCT)/AIG2-like uncharacterized protein YtfP
MNPDFPTDLIIGGEHRNRQENVAFDIDIWYPLLKDITMETKFLPLTMQEHFAVVRYYRMRFLQREAFGAYFSSADQFVLSNLVRKLEHVMESLSPPENPNTEPAFFVRLCGRSPKDGEPLNQEAIKLRYFQTLSELGNRGFDVKDSNTQTMAIAFLNHLRIQNGEEALNLLLTSERIYIDLLDAIRCGEFDQLVVRKWIPELTYDREFRMFVYNKKLTVITQYDHYCCYPYLHDEKEEIQQRLIDFWENEINPRMRTVPNYIVDVADIPGKGVVLIELSPFLKCTGTALFNWKLNKQQLMNGPFEFRLRTIPYPGLSDLLEAGWLSRFQDLVPPYWEYYPAEESKGLFTLFKNWCMSWFEKGEERIFVFVYGLLKQKGFYHQKFLAESRFVGTATTVEKFRMFVDGNGAPQLIHGNDPEHGKKIRGELLELPTTLMEFFMNNKFVRRGFYEIKSVSVMMEGAANVCEARCIFRKIESVREELESVKFVSQYRTGARRTRLNPVMDMIRKAEFYLGYPIMVME